MAHNIIKSEYIGRNDNGKVICRIEAVLDATSDLEALGTDYAPGSTAIVADSGAAVYMVNASGEWKEI